MRLKKNLEVICKNLSGSLLAIGIDDNIEEMIDRNKNISVSYFMNFDGNKKTKSKIKDKNKKISIKKIRKQFKKKKIDTIICNIKDVKRFLRTFIKDSVYINKKMMYIYGNVDDIDILELENKYKRYDTSIKIDNYDKQFLMTIDMSKAKNYFFKDLKYSFVDGFVHVVDVIGDVLIG